MDKLYPKLEQAIAALDVNSIPQGRKDVLEPLAKHISQNLSADKVILQFICTHNSRRSHLSQVWAQAMAHHYGFDNVQCFSGGTESTAIYPTVLSTLKESGFEVKPQTEGSNPQYAIELGSNISPVLGFSKTIDSPFNPQQGFAAIMTCSQADTDCPFVPGAAARLSVPYEDPKVADGTEGEDERYRERSVQIATEMKFVFSRVVEMI